MKKRLLDENVEGDLWRGMIFGQEGFIQIARPQLAGHPECDLWFGFQEFHRHEWGHPFGFIRVSREVFHTVHVFQGEGQRAELLLVGRGLSVTGHVDA